MLYKGFVRRWRISDCDLFDKLVKSPKFRHAPAFAGAGSAKAGIQNYLKTLDSCLRGNDIKGRFKTFYETIILAKVKNIKERRYR